MTTPEDPFEKPADPFAKPDQPSGFPPPGAYPPPPSGFPPPPAVYGGYPPAPSAPYQQGGPAGPPGTYFDPSSGLYFPHGTELASVGRRIGAYFLAIPLFIVTLGIGYLVWGLAIWSRGQTPTLQVLNMRVWRPETGRPASFGFMALREIIGRIVDSILWIITLLTSFIMMVAGKQRKTLHDMVAGTVVLYDPNKVIGR